jgi:uncharacterized protein
MYIQRDIEEKIQSRLDSEEILILKGPRQIGKSTLLKKLIKDVGRKASAYYINLENQINLEYLNDSPLNLFKIIPLEKGKKQYVFIDEIQYLKDPSNFLKVLCDSYKNELKLVVSMTSILNGNGNSLMGQNRVYEIGSLSFREFLKHKNSRILDFFSQEVPQDGSRREIPAIYRDEIDQHFFEYIKYGGYPSVVLEKESAEKERLLEELINSYINLEVQKIGIRDTVKFFRLMKLLAERVGDLLNMSELAQALNVSSPTVESYVRILCDHMKIRIIKPYFSNHSKELNKMSKFYFSDLGIRNAILNNFDNMPDRWDRERYFENIVFNFLCTKDSVKSLHFWRTQNKHEVDFIINEKYALETKFNPGTVNRTKFKAFNKLYPDIDLQFVTYGPKTNGHLSVLDIG